MKSKTSSKTKPSATKSELGWLDWEDSMLRHCRTIKTLAALLFHTGGKDDGVTPDVISDAGGMLKAEVEHLRKQVYARPGRGAK
jgi:hypothetical protein